MRKFLALLAVFAWAWLLGYAAERWSEYQRIVERSKGAS
jgi:hypothetical protein